MLKEDLNNAIANLIQPDRIDLIFNYEDWSQLMPLVVEHHITLEVFEDGSGRAGQYFEHENSRHSSVSIKPQRALAECLYKVLLDKVGE